jgi:hypothetical protein
VQNVTFAWTKLPTAFFVLGGLYFTLNKDEEVPAMPRTTIAALCFSAALLTHYSAAAYIIAVGGICAGRFRIRSRVQARRLAVAHIPSVLLVATWLLWSMWHYGWSTYSANTVIAYSSGTQLGDMAHLRLQNLFSLLVPHPLRLAEYQHIEQDSLLGVWRDYFFNLYQTNLLFSFGTGGFLLVAALIWKYRREKTRFWGPFVLIVIGLSLAVISWPDRWGSAHIGLQALALMGLAWIAGSWNEFSPKLRRCLFLGLVVDTIAGIGLHFYLQHSNLSEVYPHLRGSDSLIQMRGFATWANFYGKLLNHLEFLGDQNFPAFSHGVIVVLTLAMAVYRARSVQRGVAGLPATSLQQP